MKSLFGMRRDTLLWRTAAGLAGGKCDTETSLVTSLVMSVSCPDLNLLEECSVKRRQCNDYQAKLVS